MSQRDKFLTRLKSRRVDASIRFADLARLLISLGFEVRRSGSHHVFRHPAVPERVNLQAEGAYAKPYQVRQVRRILLKHGLIEADHGGEG